MTSIIGSSAAPALDKRAAALKDGTVRITEKHTEHLLRHGYVIVPNFLTADELSAACENFLQYYPSAEELSATPQRYGVIAEEGDALQTEFPFSSGGSAFASGGSAFAGDTLNNITTHPEIISFVERLLETKNVLLSQSAIWAKYAGAGSYEQGLHLDYQGNTLVVPRDDGDYRQVNMILYYTDVDETLGPTYVVSQEKTRDLPLWPPFRTRKKDPQLYKHERPVLASAGTLLIFSMRTFHRASDITADFGHRFSHHLVYRGGAHNFSGYHQWSRHGENPDLQRFIAHTTPRQREVLGFPPAGDAYWNEETIANVALRYPEMNMSPYHGRPARDDGSRKRTSHGPQTQK